MLDQSSWVEKLPLALNSINMMPRRSLGGLSPIGVETGREPLASASISNALLEVKEADVAVKDRLERIEVIRAEVSDTLRRYENEMKRQADKKARDWPKPGELKPGQAG